MENRKNIQKMGGIILLIIIIIIELKNCMNGIGHIMNQI